MGSLGYGTDLRGANDLTESMDELEDENSPVAIAEALYRRFDTPEGGLIDDSSYGRDIKAYIGKGFTDTELKSMASEIRAQALLDDRVANAQVTVAPGGSPLGSELLVVIRITPVDPATGVFSMTLLATSAELILQELVAA